MGQSGIRKIAELCVQKSHYLAEKISRINGYRLKYSGPFFKEFVLETPLPPSEIIAAMAEKNIFAGIDLSKLDMGEGLLVAVTEKRTKTELDKYATLLSELK